MTTDPSQATAPNPHSLCQGGGDLVDHRNAQAHAQASSDRGSDGHPAGGNAKNQRIAADPADQHVGQHRPAVGAVLEHTYTIPQLGEFHYLFGNAACHNLSDSFYTAGRDRAHISANGPCRCRRAGRIMRGPAAGASGGSYSTYLQQESS